MTAIYFWSTAHHYELPSSTFITERFGTNFWPNYVWKPLDFHLYYLPIPLAPLLQSIKASSLIILAFWQMSIVSLDSSKIYALLCPVHHTVKKNDKKRYKTLLQRWPALEGRVRLHCFAHEKYQKLTTDLLSVQLEMKYTFQKLIHGLE